MSLHIHPLTSWHRAVFLLNSRTGLFIATALSSGSKSLHQRRHPLFRSSGANLPSSLTPLRLVCCGFANSTSHGLRPAYSAAGSPDSLRPSITPTRQYRNINLLSIDYAFQPRLRIRLTPGGRTFPGKPWVFGDRNSHPVFRYSCLHGHLYAVHLRSLFGFDPHTTLFYHRE